MDETPPPSSERRSTWSPPPRRASAEDLAETKDEDNDFSGDADNANDADNLGAGADDNDQESSPAPARKAPLGRTYSGLNLKLSPSSKSAPVETVGGKSAVSGPNAEHMKSSPLVAASPMFGRGQQKNFGSKSMAKKQSQRMMALTAEAQSLVAEKMRSEAVLTLEEAAKILSVLPNAALGALTAPRYIGNNWFEIMGPDRRTSYFYNTEEAFLSSTRPEDVAVDKQQMFVTELNRRRREDFYVKTKMAAAEGLLQNQLQKKYGKQILRDEAEKVKTRRAAESASHAGFKNPAAEREKKEKDAMQHLIHEFDPRGQKLISFDMLKAGIKKISESKLYRTQAKALVNVSDAELKDVILQLAGEDLVLTTQEFDDFASGEKPSPDNPLMCKIWSFLNAVKEEMKGGHHDDDDGSGMETRIIRELTYEVRSQARQTIVKSFRELDPVLYWGFIDLDLIANLDADDLTINGADEALRAQRLKRLREQRSNILRKVQAQSYVSTTIQPIFFVGYLLKRAGSGAWVLRRFTLTGEGILHSEKVDKKVANDSRTFQELTATANTELANGQRDASGSLIKAASANAKSKDSKEKFRLDAGVAFETQISQTSEIDFTLVEQSARLRSRNSSEMDEWMTALRNLWALLRQKLTERNLKLVLAEAKSLMAAHEPILSSFFNDALEAARQAELPSRNRTVLEIQELQRYLAQIEGLQAVIDDVKVSRSIDDLLEGIYNARGIAQDSDIMFEAQDLMEQLTLEKNAEIALKLAELENEKKQLHARRQMLNALLDIYLTDNFNRVRRVEEAYKAFCHDKQLPVEEELLLFARSTRDALRRHVEARIEKQLTAVAGIPNLASSIAALDDSGDVDRDILEQAEKAIKQTINTICANLATPDKAHRGLVIEKVPNCRNEYNVQQEDGVVVQAVHSNNLQTLPEDETPEALQRDMLHKFRVGQNVDVWHGITDHLHVQEQISDAKVLGIPEDSKIVMATDFLGQCLMYLRKARKLGIPCDDTFKALRNASMIDEEDYCLFDDTPFSHTLNRMTMPDELVLSDFDSYKDACDVLSELMEYLDSCKDAAMLCGLEEDCNAFRRLEMLKSNMQSQQARLDARQNLYRALDEAVDVVTHAADAKRWVAAVVVRNDNLGNSLIVDIQDTLLEGMGHVVTVPLAFLRTPAMVSICDNGYFDVGEKVCLRKDKDAWSEGFREVITIEDVDLPKTWHNVDVRANPALRHELTFSVKYAGATEHGATLSSIRSEQVEILPESEPANLQKDDKVLVAHSFLHAPILKARIQEARESGLDENMEAFVVANTLLHRIEYDYTLLESQLENSIARFPYQPDGAMIKASIDFLAKAQTAERLTLHDEDAELLALAERYMGIIKARAHLREAMLEASKLRNGLELKRALELAISYGVIPTSSLCRSVKQLMYTFVGENSKIKAEQQLQKVCETSYPILPEICPKLQTALFVGVRPINPVLITKATDLLMSGFTRRKVRFVDLFKVIHQAHILSFLEDRDLNALLVNRQFYEYVMRHSYFHALYMREAKLQKSKFHRTKTREALSTPKHTLDLTAPPKVKKTPFGFGSAAPRFAKDELVSPQENRKVELEKIRRAREKLLRKMWF